MDWSSSATGRPWPSARTSRPALCLLDEAGLLQRHGGLIAEQLEQPGIFFVKGLANLIGMDGQCPKQPIPHPQRDAYGGFNSDVSSHGRSARPFAVVVDE